MAGDSAADGYAILGIAFRDERDAAVRFMAGEGLALGLLLNRLF